jgi:hypothetical protein
MYYEKLYVVLLTKCYNQIKLGMMGLAFVGWVRGEMRARVCWENLKDSGHLEDLHVEGTRALKWIFDRIAGHGFRTGTSGKLL